MSISSLLKQLLTSVVKNLKMGRKSWEKLCNIPCRNRPQTDSRTCTPRDISDEAPLLKPSGEFRIEYSKKKSWFLARVPETNQNSKNAKPCATLAKFSVDSLTTESNNSSEVADQNFDNNCDTLTMSSLDTNWTYVSVDESFVQNFVSDVIKSAVNIVKSENETYEREVRDLPKLNLQRLNSARSDISIGSLKRIQGSSWNWRDILPVRLFTREQ